MNEWKLKKEETNEGRWKKKPNKKETKINKEKETKNID